MLNELACISIYTQERQKLEYLNSPFICMEYTNLQSIGRIFMVQKTLAVKYM